MNKIILGSMFCGLLALAGCTSGKTKAAFTLDTALLTTKNVDAVKGQKATCAGPAVKTFNLEAIETNAILEWDQFCSTDLQRAYSGAGHRGVRRR